MAQDGTKMAQDGAKMTQDGAKRSPRWSQDGAKMSQDGAKMGQDGGRMEPHWRFGDLGEALERDFGRLWENFAPLPHPPGTAACPRQACPSCLAAWTQARSAVWRGPAERGQGG